MTIENIKRAQAEAKRFLTYAKDVLENGTHESTWQGKITQYLDHGKRTGALRRASMDLTRALAEMRKP